MQNDSKGTSQSKLQPSYVNLSTNMTQRYRHLQKKTIDLTGKPPADRKNSKEQTHTVHNNENALLSGTDGNSQSARGLQTQHLQRGGKQQNSTFGFTKNYDADASSNAVTGTFGSAQGGAKSNKNLKYLLTSNYTQPGQQTS